eukprot:6201689-Pleurochrysis_carterae.AAC.1
MRQQCTSSLWRACRPATTWPSRRAWLHLLKCASKRAHAPHAIPHGRGKRKKLAFKNGDRRR